MVIYGLHHRSRATPISFAILLVPLFLQLSCASAQKRYEQGLVLESEGRYAEAAFHYIRALRKEPGLESARVRLRQVGPQAVARNLELAEQEDARGRPDEAADLVLTLDDLRRQSAEVGVDLTVPPDYAVRRRAYLDRAIDAALADGEAAARSGNFQAAIARLARAGERYDPGPGQLDGLRGAAFAAWMAWADAEASAGRYRAAYERAAHALDVPGLRPGTVAEARRFQAFALERGTRRVALLPIEALESAERHLPADLLEALNDEFQLEAWNEPPQFVAPVPAVEVRVALRRLGLSRRILSSREAATVGRDLDADFVVVAEIDSAWTDEANVRSSRRRARTRAGADTAYTVEEGRRRTGARVAFGVVDVSTRRTVDSGSLAATASREFRRGRFPGNPNELDLPRAERDLFDRGEYDAERRIVEELVDDLAPRIPRAVFDRLLSRIP